MLIEYVAFGALVVAALVATFVGLRRRRADRLTADPTATFPYIGSGTSGFGTHHSGHSGLGSNGGGGSFGGAGDVGGGSGGGGGVDGGGGQGN
jgi:hypothetical protein